VKAACRRSAASCRKFCELPVRGGETVRWKPNTRHDPGEASVLSSGVDRGHWEYWFLLVLCYNGTVGW